MKDNHRLLGGVLLVAGTTVGAAILALPVVTALSGLFPTLILFLLYWVYMTFTAFLFLELNLWLGQESNMISMAKSTLGKFGEGISWITYLFLLYLLTTAYLAGGSTIVAHFLSYVLGVQISPWVTTVGLLAIFGFFIYEGTRYADLLNRQLMLGLILSYILLIYFLSPYVETALYDRHMWRYTFLSLSLVATSFGFHIIIPTLTTYLRGDVHQLKRAIFIGSLIPLAIYVIWEFATLGVLPVDGPNGAMAGYIRGESGVFLLGKMIAKGSFEMVSHCFSFFAILTSFLGVTLSLTDFLSDGFKIKKTRLGKLILFALTFTLPLFFTLTYPRAFFNALEYAGAFGVVILLGILPCAMVWSARYRMGMRSSFTTPGGKPALLAAFAFSLFVIAVEMASKLGYLQLYLFNGEI